MKHPFVCRVLQRVMWNNRGTTLDSITMFVEQTTSVGFTLYAEDIRQALNQAFRMTQHISNDKENWHSPGVGDVFQVYPKGTGRFDQDEYYFIQDLNGSWVNMPFGFLENWFTMPPGDRRTGVRNCLNKNPISGLKSNQLLTLT